MQQPKEKRPYVRSRFRARIRALLEESYIFLLCLAVAAVIVSIVALVIAVTQMNNVVGDMTYEIRAYRKDTLRIMKETNTAIRSVNELNYEKKKTDAQIAQLHAFQASILKRLAALEGQRQKVPP